MQYKKPRESSNLKMLEFAAIKLGKLNDEVVYLGGCTTALFITDPLSLDVRPTMDVDCIIDVISWGQYHQFGEKLRAIGFKQSAEDSIICRWHYDDLILDIMPTDEEILGFSNRWYKEALKHSESHELSDDLMIKSVTVPYFLATKIEAFQSRGNNDFYGSHDFEDLIAVLSGRSEIITDLAGANDGLKSYIKKFFLEIYKKAQFELSLPGHLNDGPVTMQRVQMVKKRIQDIMNS